MMLNLKMESLSLLNLIRKKQSEAKGKLRGIGLTTYFEACGIAPSPVVMMLGCGVGLWESAEVRFNPTGQVTVYSGSHSHGQSHQTTFAQITADELGVPIENIDIVQGDTEILRMENLL